MPRPLKNIPRADNLKLNMGRPEKIGLTSTVPVEAVLAAGFTPLDLNNLFIGSGRAEALVQAAEARGFPSALCSWIKGIHQAGREARLAAVIGVTRGDCSSAEKLMEIWRHEGLAAVPFAYPEEPDPDRMREEIEKLCRRLGASLTRAERVRAELGPIRSLLSELDRMSFEEGRITGVENHLWLVSASDFGGDPAAFRSRLLEFLAAAKTRPARRDFLRLGYLGVPPIIPGLYEMIEQMGGRVIYNEVQLEFAMLGDHPDLAAQYTAYTYPYSTLVRIEKIRAEIERRALKGVIHYAQTFCHRQLESLLLRELLPVPALFIEADRPGPVDSRTRTRVQAFLEQLADQPAPP